MEPSWVFESPSPVLVILGESFNFLSCSQVHHINANFFLDQTAMKPEEEGATFSFSAGFEDPSTATYINFLKEGLEKAKEYLAQ